MASIGAKTSWQGEGPAHAGMSENATVEWRRWLGRHWAAVLIAAMVLAAMSAPRAATLKFVEALFDGSGGVDGLELCC